MPKAINITLLDNKPTGRIRCSMFAWTGVIFRIPRNKINECADIKKLNNSGVYFLIGKNEENNASQIYVGQAVNRKNGKGILQRIQNHITSSNKEGTLDSKWYFNEVLIVTTTDNSFGSTEVSFLEHYFYNEAKKQNRYEVMNGNDPTIGNIDEVRENQLYEFINVVKMIVATLGYKAFEPLLKEQEILESKSEYKEYFYTYKGETATCIETDEGYVLKHGITIFPVDKGKEKLYPQPYNLQNKFSKLIKNRILQEDVLFDSPSAAAMFISGGSVSGRTCWKDKNGKTIKELEEE